MKKDKCRVFATVHIYSAKNAQCLKYVRYGTWRVSSSYKAKLSCAAKKPDNRA